MHFFKHSFQIFICVVLFSVVSACASESTLNNNLTTEPSVQTATVNKPSTSEQNVIFSYTGNNKNLHIAGDLCRYGRRSKTQLPNLAMQEIHQYVQTHPIEFSEQIKSLKQGMMGQRIDIAKLSVFYLLKQQNIDFNYYLEGNKACTKYKTDLTLDFNKNFINFIKLNAPEKYQFIANINNKQHLTSTLNAVYPDLALNHQKGEQAEFLTAKYLIEEKQLNKELSLLTFNYLRFKKDTLEQQRLFYSTGDTQLVKALNQYLVENGYILSANKSHAFWQLTIRNPESNINNAFTVQYKNSSSSVTKQITNQTNLLPKISVNTEQEKINLIKLYLEMMKFSEQLERL